MRNSINTSINTSIRNELKLNSQTKLWLNIISIPAIELKEKIEKAIEENPFLEYDIKSNHNNLDINSIIENTASNSKESLFEHLKSQISIVFNNKKDIELAELISTFINENGYLTISSEEIADILNISVKKANEIIKILKTLEPIGIAAKNISECLSTQLKNKENIDKNIVFEVKNTICNATSIRQKETQEIAKQVDLMIIIGGKHSSNTTKVYEIAKKECKNCILIETSEELNKNRLKNISKIGIMAGASTPSESINNTVEKLKEIC